MSKIPTFERFVSSFKKGDGSGRPSARMIQMFGETTFEAAYPKYVEYIIAMLDLKSKVDAFEQYLINIGAPCQQSSKSESRYYSYKGMQYRFSSHVYPTGSMTSDFCIDLCADKHLINTIIF